MKENIRRRDQQFPVKVKRGSVEVNIYRTTSRGYDQFTVSYYQDSQRKRIAFSTLEDAKSHAEIQATRLSSSDAAVLKLSGADLSAYQRARQLLDPLCIAIEVAAAEYSDVKKKLPGVSLSHAVDFYLKRHPHKIEPRTVQSVVDELIAVKKADKLSDRYLESLKWAFAKFTSAFKCTIGNVTGPEIDHWLRESGLSPRTRNNLRNSVQTLFSFAKARRYVPKDHDEISDVPLAKDRGGKIEIFTPSELEEILACAGKQLTPFIVLGAFAGIRHAEIQRLAWQDIHFDDGIIEIRAANAKTASRRTLPILDNLRPWLLPFKKDAGFVCPYRNVAVELHFIAKRINQKRRATWAQNQKIAVSELERADRLVREQTKAPKKIGQQKCQVPPGAETAQAEGWEPFAWKRNALRHSFISYRIAEIKNVAQVALEAGNSPQIIHSNYKELVRPADARRWFSIVPDQAGKIISVRFNSSKQSVNV